MDDKIKYKGYTIRIEQDIDPLHPRRDCDPYGTMVCFHPRYDLGDKHDYRHEDYSEWNDMEKAIVKQEDAVVILPLYLYDHSGITISTTAFNCPWDSGQVGFIFATRKQTKKYYGVKKITKKTLARLKAGLEASVREYDQFLTGDVWGYRIIDVDEDGEETDEHDSCWGFYGHDYCVEQAKLVVDGYPAKAEKIVAAGI